MSSQPGTPFRHVFSDESEELLAPATFQIPVESVVRALRRAARKGADHLYETMLKIALMIEMKAQTYGLAIFYQKPGEPLTLKWAEGLDDAEMQVAETKVSAVLSKPEEHAGVRPGDQSLCLLLSYPDEQQQAAVIYGLCVRPLTPTQAKEIRILTEVAHLAHEHAALRDELQQTTANNPAGITITETPPNLKTVPDEPEHITLPGVVYESRALAELARSIDRIKDSKSTVLINGESGTGKELVAHAIHRLGRRAQSPFIPFNCTAAPGDLIESLLFGHRKGSFTGAHADHEGLIRAAEGGTLFLDEIGDLPLSLQPKLLRFLQDGEVHPLGEREPRRVNVRVVAATHKNLERAVKDGQFREDLYYRIAGLTLFVPPLRERPEDTAALISHFLTYHTRRNDRRDVRGITYEAIHALQNYSWPGNVRELGAEIERLVLYADQDAYIDVDDLSPRIRPANEQSKNRASQKDDGLSTPRTPLETMLEDTERRIITDTLKRCDYNVALAATALGLGSRQTLYKKLKRLSINLGDLLQDE